MDTTDFDNVKDQIGCCGIWCGSCVVGNGLLRQLTAKYREIAEAYGLRGWAAEDFDYDEFAKGLQSIESTPSCSGCLKGGGRDDCALRSCVFSRGVRDCTECDARGDCPHAELLEHMRSGALAAGLFVREDEGDREALLEAWLVRIGSQWPSSLLFEDQC